MGIKNISKILKPYGHPKNLKEFSGMTAAIDASIYLYKFKYSATQSVFLRRFYNQLSLFKSNGVIPIYIFDGKPPEEKKETTEKRHIIKENSGLVITKEDVSVLQEMFHILGVKYQKAVSEGEKYCALLNKLGKVDFVLSNDYDTLTFGCKKLVTLNNGIYMEYNLEEILEGLGVSYEEYVDVCISCGCDYHPGVHGLGPVKSLKKVKSKTLVIPEDMNIERLRSLFITDEPLVGEDVVEVSRDFEEFCELHDLVV